MPCVVSELVSSKNRKSAGNAMKLGVKAFVRFCMGTLLLGIFSLRGQANGELSPLVRTLLHHSEIQAWIARSVGVNFRLGIGEGSEVGARWAATQLERQARLRAQFEQRLANFEARCRACRQAAEDGADILREGEGARALSETFLSTETEIRLGQVALEGRVQGRGGVAGPRSLADLENQEGASALRRSQEERALRAATEHTLPRGSGNHGVVTSVASRGEAAEIPTFDFATETPSITETDFFPQTYLESLSRARGESVRIHATAVPLMGLPGGATVRSIRVFARVGSDAPFFTLSLYRARTGRVWLDSLVFENPLVRRGGGGTSTRGIHQLEGVPLEVWDSLRSGIEGILRAMGARGEGAVGLASRATSRISMMRFSSAFQWEAFRAIFGAVDRRHRPRTGSQELDQTFAALGELNRLGRSLPQGFGPNSFASPERMGSWIDGLLRQRDPSREAQSRWREALRNPERDFPGVMIYRSASGQPLLLRYAESDRAVPEFAIVDPVSLGPRGQARHFRLLTAQEVERRLGSMEAPAWSSF